jgi:hypothetical protein
MMNVPPAGGIFHGKMPAMGAVYTNFRKKLGTYGLETYYVTLIVLGFLLWWVPSNWGEAGVMGIFLAAMVPFALPVLLGVIYNAGRLEAAQQEDYWDTEHTILEIRLPEEITQSPRAMELVLRVMYQTGEVDTVLHHIRGKTRPWFSLEIVSTEGQVRFYMWTRSRYKEIVKAQIYAHYPTVQVVEVPDYTLNFPWDPETKDLWGVEYALQKPDPFPIQTYVAWGLDKADTKEEFKNDPLLSILEFMGSIGKGEHLWLQYVIKGHTKGDPGPGSYCPWAMGAEDAHKHPIHEKINIVKWAEIEKEKITNKTISGGGHGEEKEAPNYTKLSQGDKDLLDAMERKLNKQVFDVGIRFMYLCNKENKQSRNAGLPTAMRSFEHGSEGRGLNGLKPIFYIGPFNWPWEDFMGIRRARRKKRMYDGYVTRQYFYAPFHDMHIVLNIEEIASLYHFPGTVAHTPTLERMPSRRAEAPANLPT